MLLAGGLALRAEADMTWNGQDTGPDASPARVVAAPGNAGAMRATTGITGTFDAAALAQLYDSVLATPPKQVDGKNGGGQTGVLDFEGLNGEINADGSLGLASEGEARSSAVEGTTVSFFGEDQASVYGFGSPAPAR